MHVYPISIFTEGVHACATNVRPEMAYMLADGLDADTRSKVGDGAKESRRMLR